MSGAARAPVTPAVGSVRMRNLRDWPKRYRASGIELPAWARRAPERNVISCNADGKWEIYSWNSTTGARHQITDRPSGTTHARITPDGRRIWWLDDRPDETGEWRVAPFEGGRSGRAPIRSRGIPTGLAFGRRATIVGFAAQGRSTLYAVGLGRSSRAIYAHASVSSFEDLSADGQLLCLEHFDGGDPNAPSLRVVGIDGSVHREISRPLGVWAGDWSPRPADRRLIVYANEDGYLRPFCWNVRSGVITPIASPRAECDASWTHDGRAFILVTEYAGRSRVLRADASSWREGFVAPGRIGAARERPDGTLWYTLNSASAPSRVCAEGETILAPAAVESPPGRPYEVLSAAPVPTFLVRPAGAPPWPTVVFVHGGPHDHWGISYSPRVQAWVDHGFAAVLPNYRGSTGHGTRWRDANRVNPGFTEVADLKAVTDWLVESRVADPDRLVLWGNSYGGYLVLLGAGLHPQRWSLGVASAPVADLTASYDAEPPDLQAFDRGLFGGTPVDVPQRYRERSPITYAARVRMPLLIRAGTRDVRCPLPQVLTFVAALRKAGANVELVTHSAGHSSPTTGFTVREIRRELYFAARHLGTTAPVTTSGARWRPRSN